jgi:hypothetical protein
MNRARPRFDWLAIWVLCSVWCTLCGWGLSAVGHLDRPGYAAAFLLFLAGLFLARRFLIVPSRRRLFLLRRPTYRRLLPKLWLLLVIISLIEGLLYHGDNYDYLTYRITRLLHSTNLRTNFSAPGFEWLMAPLFVAFQTDRPFFLINLISYVMLPGLVFAVFRQLGVNARVAWWWMWVLPAGLCYALEAGGLGNDMFSAVYLLAAFHYAGKARSGAVGAMALALLSMALLTNAKASNIPLALPWLVLVLFTWRKFPQDARGWTLLATAGLAGLFVSAAVIMALNYHFTGSYTGDPTDWERMQVHAPLLGFLGTGIMIVVSNLSPPLLPHDITWNLLPSGLQHAMAREFPRYTPHSPGLMLEESCSLGIGATFFLLLAFLYGLRRTAGPDRPALPAVTKWMALAMAVSWLAFMSKLASEGAPRLVAPYYLLTAALALAVLRLDGRLTHRPLWRGLAYLTVVIALAVVAGTPGRPVVPPRLLLAALKAAHVPTSAAQSWEKNQVLRAGHYDGLHDLRMAIPASEKRIGLIEGDDTPGTSLWLPFGSREVVELHLARDTAAEAQQQGIHYVAVSGDFLASHDGLTIEGFLAKWPGTVVKTEAFPLKTFETDHWYLVRLL